MESTIVEYDSMEDQLRRENNGLKNEVSRLKHTLEKLSSDIKMEEDYIANRLIKRMNELKDENQRIINENELEITNRMKEKLNALRREKVDMENKLEQEQEAILNRLSKALSEAQYEKQSIAVEIEREEEFITNSLQKQLDQLILERSELENHYTQKNDQILRDVQEKLIHVSARERDTATGIDAHLKRLLDEVISYQEQVKSHFLNDQISEALHDIISHIREIQNFEQSERNELSTLRQKLENYVEEHVNHAHTPTAQYRPKRARGRSFGNIYGNVMHLPCQPILSPRKTYMNSNLNVKKYFSKPKTNEVTTA